MELSHGLARFLGAMPPFRIRPQPNSFKHSPFKKLPIEIIRSIAEFLPISDAASLTLTCHFMFFILGNGYLNLLRSEVHQRDRVAFLELIQRGLPHQILCHYCHMLHSGTKRRHDNLWIVPYEKTAKCTTNDFASGVDYYIQDEFSSITFQSAMKLHRHGLDCSEQLSALTAVNSLTWEGNTHHYESIPQIVNGHFLLRHQLWLLFPVGEEMGLPTTLLTDVCPHWRFHEIRSYSPTDLTLKMECQLSHWDDLQLNSSCLTCSGLFQCSICPTEFQIDVKDFTTNGVALVVTRWLDLGEGRTPLDPTYASHVLHRFRRRNPDSPVPFKPGSIRAAYEGEHIDIDKLLTPKHESVFYWCKPLPSKLLAITTTNSTIRALAATVITTVSTIPQTNLSTVVAAVVATTAVSTTGASALASSSGMSAMHVARGSGLAGGRRLVRGGGPSRGIALVAATAASLGSLPSCGDSRLRGRRTSSSTGRATGQGQIRRRLRRLLCFL